MSFTHTIAASYFLAPGADPQAISYLSLINIFCSAWCYRSIYPMTSSIAGESSMMSSSFTEVPVHLFALGFLESTIAGTGFLESMIPWTQAEETEETRQ